MKSIKPGRGPSMMNGVMSVAVGIFGVIWTLIALSIGAPVLFALFGLVFAGVSIYQSVYHFRNATSPKRYSVIDIVDSKEEPDPLNERFGYDASIDDAKSDDAVRFCPYCGGQIQDDFTFCSRCGKKLPS